MRYAFLGAGGIGGLLAAVLARAGHESLVLLRDETLAAYRGRFSVESVVLGDFEVEVSAAGGLDREVDVMFVATKATQLERALALAPPDHVGGAVVIPLMNGIDHMDVLRRRYENVVAGAIRVESERPSVGRIRQRSPFLRIELAGAEPVAAELVGAGLDSRTTDDERTLLWEKLAFLAPVALATTALDAPLGTARRDERFGRCRDEAFAVSEAEGAAVDRAGTSALHASAPDEMRSSMQKDVAAGRIPELDAIAGPILRRGRSHGIAVPATEALAALVERRSASR